LCKTQTPRPFSGSHINQNRSVDPTTSTTIIRRTHVLYCLACENQACNLFKPHPDMSRIQLAKPAINRGIKRKKFPHVVQVHEELGPREQRTSALKNNRARPPPRTPQRTNQPSHLPAQSTTEPARRSQHEDTATRQDSIRQMRTSTDGQRHR